MDEFLSCPFCGCDKPSFNRPVPEIKFKGSINCPACQASVPREINDDAELISAWNTRLSASSAREDGVRAFLGERIGRLLDSNDALFELDADTSVAQAFNDRLIAELRGVLTALSNSTAVLRGSERGSTRIEGSVADENSNAKSGGEA